AVVSALKIGYISFHVYWMFQRVWHRMGCITDLLHSPLFMVRVVSSIVRGSARYQLLADLRKVCPSAHIALA
ncbi:hypothetical protein COCVIDRAFT_115821, partial [Bipolaris victoriae FI3]